MKTYEDIKHPYHLCSAAQRVYRKPCRSYKSDILLGALIIQNQVFCNYKRHTNNENYLEKQL
jgi:hypothetical protein